jgi:4-hydroxyphenylpyruvate dioxygenase-like putative hemolysin
MATMLEDGDVPNPMSTDGFEFVEYTAPDPQALRRLFEQMGFPVVARHCRKDVTLHRQGDVNFIINAEQDSFAQQFARDHGPSACAMAFRVRDAAAAFRRAVDLGAKPVATPAGPMELNIPAIEGSARRVAGHREDVDELCRRRILINGNATTGEGILLQILTQKVIGPIFFEIIQRKGSEGFGEGNFRALFESIELDQIRRGKV